MGQVNVIKMDRSKAEPLELEDGLTEATYNPFLIKDAVVYQRAKLRQGTHATKSRGQVSGSTRKLYRQKGTGRARVGTRRTVLRKGGGVAFAKTRTGDDFRQQMPKKMRRLANRNALLAKLVDAEVKCVDDLTFAEPKTAEFRRLLEALGVDRSCLVALAADNRNAALSARNLPSATTIRVEQLNAFDLLNHRFVLVDRASLEAFLDGRVWKNGASKEAA